MPSLLHGDFAEVIVSQAAGEIMVGSSATGANT